MPITIDQFAEYGPLGLIAFVGLGISWLMYRDNKALSAAGQQAVERQAQAAQASSDRFIAYLEKQASLNESRDLLMRELLEEMREGRSEQTARHIENAGRITGLTREVQMATKAAERAEAAANDARRGARESR